MKNYAFDPDFLPHLSQLPTVGDYSTAEKIQAMRTMRMDTAPAPPPQRVDILREDRVVPAQSSQPAVPIRIYSPKATLKAAAGDPRPGILEIHGGGFMFGNLDMMDGWCDAIASAVDAVIVSVDYRLAPEHPFPAGVDDCYAALRWMADNVKALGVDPKRIAIAGHSMGGWVTANTAAQDHALMGAILISAADMGARGVKANPVGLAAAMDDNREALAGVTGQDMAAQLIAYGASWDRLGPGLKDTRLLVLHTDDGLRPDAERLIAAVKAAGGTQVQDLHVATDHGWSDHRVALQALVINWLGGL